jgi:hypothetical protein
MKYSLAVFIIAPLCKDSIKNARISIKTLKTVLPLIKRALPVLTGLFRQQLYCWQAARFAKQIELPPYLAVFHANSWRANYAVGFARSTLRYTRLYGT